MFGSPSRYNKEISMRGELFKYLEMSSAACHRNACIKDLLNLFKYQINFKSSGQVHWSRALFLSIQDTYRMRSQPLTSAHLHFLFPCHSRLCMA